jgi:hypothetical protein
MNDEMRVKLGVQVDPLNFKPPGSPDPTALGIFKWVRFVAQLDPTDDRRVAAPHPAIVEYASKINPDEVGCILVLASESFRDSADFDRCAEQAHEYAKHLAPHCWQIGNEPDGKPPSSWVMDPPSRYGELVNKCAQAIRDAGAEGKIITAGLCSGNHLWLKDCGPLPVDGVAVHPYLQRPIPPWPSADWPGPEVGAPAGDDVHTLLDRYANEYHKDLWITEFGTRFGAIAEEQEIEAEHYPEYYARMFTALAARPDVRVACAFCYSDGMVPGFGLRGEDGKPKPVCENLEAAVLAD